MAGWSRVSSYGVMKSPSSLPCTHGEGIHTGPIRPSKGSPPVHPAPSGAARAHHHRREEDPQRRPGPKSRACCPRGDGGSCWIDPEWQTAKGGCAQHTIDSIGLKYSSANAKVSASQRRSLSESAINRSGAGDSAGGSWHRYPAVDGPPGSRALQIEE